MTEQLNPALVLNNMQLRRLMTRLFTLPIGVSLDIIPTNHTDVVHIAILVGGSCDMRTKCSHPVRHTLGYYHTKKNIFRSCFINKVVHTSVRVPETKNGEPERFEISFQEIFLADSFQKHVQNLLVLKAGEGFDIPEEEYLLPEELAYFRIHYTTFYECSSLILDMKESLDRFKEFPTTSLAELFHKE